MKTLYINLNGEDVKSSDNFVVVGSEKDNIINKFYIALGTEICDGVIVKGVRKKQLVTEFESEHPQDFKTILNQWDEIRYKLLGNNPLGEYSVKLPNAYLEWLQYHQNSEYRKIYTQKFSNQKGISVSLNIKQLYEDTIEIFIYNVESDDYNKLVVGDEFVTWNSAIVESIKKEYPKIAFEPIDEWNKLRNVDERPAYIEDRVINCDDNVNIRSNQSDCIVFGGKTVYDIVKEHQEWFKYESLDHNFYKGKTVNDVEEERYDNWGNPISEYFDFYGFIIGLSKGRDILEAKEERLRSSFDDEAFMFYRISSLSNDSLPTFYQKFGINWDKSLFEIKELFVRAGFKIEKECSNELEFQSPYSTKYRGQLTITFTWGPTGLSRILWFSLSDWEVEKVCPKCGSNDVDNDDCGCMVRCNKCKHVWDCNKTCPKCGSADVNNDGTGFVQYRCNMCNHIWGDNNEIYDFSKFGNDVPVDD